MKRKIFSVCARILIGALLWAPQLSLATEPIHTNWFNGTYADDVVWDYTTDLSRPNYGTHDWIADHAKNILPPYERQWIDANYNAFLLGTEAPDNAALSFLGPNTGYGDFDNHEIWFSADGRVVKDSAARRAQEEYNKAAAFLPTNESLAAYYAGSMTHYLADVAAYPHVMGTGSHLGVESYHAQYERGVDYWTKQYVGGVFESYLHPSTLVSANPYDAVISIARGSDFGVGDTKAAQWMNSNIPVRNDSFYPNDNLTFTRSAGDSLNRAVNTIANVLHTLSQQRGYVLERLPSIPNSDRIDTAIAISQKVFPTSLSAGAVALVSTTDISSALVAAPYLKSLNGMVLLTPTFSLSSRTSNEIARILPNRADVPIYIIGGTNAVVSDVETTLRSRFKNTVTRIGTDDPAETSAALASRMSASSAALLANVNGIDAVSAAGVAANKDMPLLLTNGASLSNALVQFRATDKGRAVTRITVLGGTAAVSDAIVDTLRGFGITVTRLGGADRFETAQLLNQRFYSSPIQVIMANGYSQVDAVTGAALAARASAPIALTTATGIPASTLSYLTAQSGSLQSGFVLGGTAAVGYSVERTAGVSF